MKIIPKPEHSSLDWLLARQRDENGRTIVGGSDAPALMGASPYKTRADLFMDKVTTPEPPQFNMAFHRGNLLEPSLVQEASRVLKVDLLTPEVMYREGRWNINSDAVDNADSPSINIECKTTTRYQIQTADDLPVEWRWQGWAQMLVLQVPVFFSVLDARQNLAVVELPRNDEAMDALLVEAEHFCSGIDNGTAMEELLDQLTATQIASLVPARPEPKELEPDVLKLIEQLDMAKMLKRDAEKMESEARDAIARLLLDSEVGAVGGVPVVSWKAQRGRTTVDVEAMRQSHPKIVARFEREGSPYRVMRIMKKKEKKNNAV